MKHRHMLLVVVAVAVAVGGTARELYWRGAVATERVATADAIKKYEAVVKIAAQKAVAAEILRIEASALRDSAATVAKSAGRRELAAAKQVSTFRLAAQAAADTCTEVIFEAEKAISEAVATAEGWHEAYEQESAANGKLEASNDSLAAAFKELKPAADNVAGAAKKLVDATRPGFFRRIAPQVGVGVGVGLDVLGKPNAVGGVTLGWKF